MNAPASPGMWDATYRKFHLGNEFETPHVEISTALTDHLTLVSDLEIKVSAGGGRGWAYAEIRLSAPEMRELAEILKTAADRVDELEQLRQQPAHQQVAA